MRVEDVVNLFVEQQQADGRSPHTISQARRHGMLAARYFGERPIDEITHVEIARFLNSAMAVRTADGREKKATSSNALRSSVRCLFAYAHASGVASQNSARLVKRARTSPPPPRGLSDLDRERLVAELAKATTWAERRDRALFMTLLLGGLRIGSAVAARVDDLDLNEGTLRLTRMKGDAADTVFISPVLAEILREWTSQLPAGSHLFPAADGGEVGGRQAHRRLAQIARRAGITRVVSPHCLRHSFAMRVYGRTGDLLVTARALCHRSTAATAVYARADAARVRAAVGA